MALFLTLIPPSPDNVLHSKDSPEWYTPKPFVNSAKTVFGGEIDLDPASHPEANAYIKALHIYTEQDNGLKQPWFGHVFLNPPGGLVNEFWDKVLLEILGYEDVIWIGYSLEQLQTLQTEFSVTPLDFTTCFLKKRIPFIENEAKRVARIKRLLAQGKTPNKKSQPSHGNYITYVGPNKAAFAAEFEKYGKVVLR